MGESLNIDKKEVLRYLGHKDQEIDQELDSLIDTCIVELEQVARPLYTYRVFDVAVTDNSEISIVGTNLILKGNDIFTHLKDAKKCAILAATLGVSVDNKIRVMGKTDLTKSFILDACATDRIEKVCDKAEAEIIEQAKAEGFKTNFRYSPGYGDLPIDIQGEIISILNANKTIGLTTTATSILIPRKSVTALVGFLEPEAKVVKKRNCGNCNLRKTCNFRREGGSCGS